MQKLASICVCICSTTHTLCESEKERDGEPYKYVQNSTQRYRSPWECVEFNQNKSQHI